MKNLTLITLNETQLLNNEHLSLLKAGGGPKTGPVKTTGGTTHSTTTTSVRDGVAGVRIVYYIDPNTGLEVIVEYIPAPTSTALITP